MKAESNPEKKEATLNLFNVLEKGDRKIKKMNKKAIILVGMSRSGKSCTFNWILGRKLIGRAEKDDDTAFVYELVVSDQGQDVAKLGQSFTSVTLVPNYCVLPNGIGLIDMAGFKDKRNYVGAVGVSYFLKKVFDKVEEAKFLIVLDEAKLNDTTGSDLKDTFLHFIRMFHLIKLRPEQRMLFYKSIAIVVTRFKQIVLDFEKKFIALAAKYEDPQLSMEEVQRKLLVEMLRQLAKNYYFEQFSQAVLNKPPQECEIIQNLTQKEWDFFKFKECQAKLGTSFINLPFSSHYKNLEEEDKSLMAKSLESRIQDYAKFGRYLGQIIKQFWEKWKIMVKLQPNPVINQQFKCNLFNFNQSLKKMDIFLKQTDVYDNSQQNKLGSIWRIQQVNLQKIVSSLINIICITETISTQGTDFFANMKKYTELYEKMVNELRPLCNQGGQIDTLLRINYVLKRGFQQFTELYGIDPSLSSKANLDIKDRCVMQILTHNKVKLLEDILLQMKPQLMNAFFPKIEDLKKYEQFVTKYQDYYSQEAYKNISSYSNEAINKHDITLNITKTNLHEAKAKLLRKDNKKDQALKQQLEALILVVQKKKIVERQNNHINEQKEKIRIISAIVRRMCGQIVQSLLDLDTEFSNLKSHSIQLSKIIQDIDLEEQSFEVLIKQKQKVDIDSYEQELQGYIEFCKASGYFEKAISLYRKCIRISMKKQNDQSMNNYQSQLSDMIKKKSGLWQTVEKNNENQFQLDIDFDRLEDKTQSLKRELQQLISKRKFESNEQKEEAY